MSRIAIRHFCANSKFARGEAEFSGVIESSPFLGLRPMHFAGRSCFAKSSTLQVWMPQLDRGLGVGNFRSFHSCSLLDRKSTRLNSSHLVISYAVFCLKKKKKNNKSSSIHTGTNAAIDC